jgi:hypothetical protein
VTSTQHGSDASRVVPGNYPSRRRLRGTLQTNHLPRFLLTPLDLPGLGGPERACGGLREKVRAKHWSRGQRIYQILSMDMIVQLLPSRAI